MQYVPVYIDDLPEVDPFPFVLFSTMNGRFFPMLDHGQAMDMAKRLQLKQNEQIWAYLAPEDFSGYLRLLYGQNTQDRHIPRLRYLHDHFFPVEGISLRAGTLFPCHLFTLNDQLEPSLILANQLRAINNQVEPEHLEIYPLWIHRNDIEAYETYLHQCWEGEANEKQLNPEGGILLRMSACRATYDLFRNEEVPKAIETAKQVVKRLCRAILYNPNNYYSLLKVSDLWFNT
ncbi:MAG: hypothetical protein HQL55_20150, partial [Magnetococcales bacterium]|nr:hypothetical protein [Magnetococcales bacterium]